MQLLTLAVASGVTVSPAIGRAVSFLRQGSLPTWGYRFLASPFSLLPNSSRSESPLSPKVQGAPRGLLGSCAGREESDPPWGLRARKSGSGELQAAPGHHPSASLLALLLEAREYSVLLLLRFPKV